MTMNHEDPSSPLTPRAADGKVTSTQRPDQGAATGDQIIVLVLGANGISESFGQLERAIAESLVDALSGNGAPDDRMIPDARFDSTPGTALTPRNGYVLELTAREMRLLIVEEPEWLLERLPPVAQREGLRFAEKMLAGMDALIADLEAVREPHPNSTAEEMLLLLLIEMAESVWNAIGEDKRYAELTGNLELLPVRSGDGDFDKMFVRWFRDHDVIALFDEPAKSSRASSASARGEGRLAPRNWFEPFRGERHHK